MEIKGKIVEVNKDNMNEHPQYICYINPKHPCFHLKDEWLLKRFDEGLKIKLFYPENAKKAEGFIEYTLGENCWRGLNAKGYMVIHCLWVSGKKYRDKGIGSLLISDCEKEAKEQGLNGVAVLCSSDAFMAGEAIFLKNNYTLVQKHGKHYSLYVKQFRDGEMPSINIIPPKTDNQGTEIFYSHQCPWVARFMFELKDYIKEKNLDIRITEITSPKEAQNMLSPYSSFILTHNGKLLADHYISMTRFENILKKEKLI
ncbi:MAG: GNAT family N-acetyltransferase [Candidatus Cloacimonetes bacterium]|nr:GNAT family N-acetyltransferase [Candidatus Cloacimonadota bacterium]